MTNTFKIKTIETFKVLHIKRHWLDRLLNTVAAYTFFAFCIWLSRDSTFWTFVCGLLFFIAFWGYVASVNKTHSNRFNSVKELQDWANSLNEKGDVNA